MSNEQIPKTMLVFDESVMSDEEAKAYKDAAEWCNKKLVIGPTVSGGVVLNTKKHEAPNPNIVNVGIVTQIPPKNV